MIEFTIVGPALTLIGTLILQFTFIFNAKNLVNHAGFMAARAGSMGNATLSSIENAYAQALIPLYGGGLNNEEIVASLVKARADLIGNARIEIINPTKESFDDWADTSLKDKYKARAIPNAGMNFKDLTQVKNNSGQTLQDANLLKLKITHGYELKIPLASTLMQMLMKWSDSGTDSFATLMYSQRRLPLVSHITVQMHSDPIEPEKPVSIVGLGNQGQPKDPGFTEPEARTPPVCMTAGCTVIVDPVYSGTTGGSKSPQLLDCQPGDILCKKMPSPVCTAS